MNYALHSGFKPETTKTLFPFDQKTLQEYFEYDYESGNLINKKNRGCAKAGNVAGSNQMTRAGKMYNRIGFKGKKFYAHVMIMALLGVFVPAHLEIDHIDGDGLNNRIENLRIVTHAENMRNKKLKGKIH